jgi:ribose/xylose/arabinose/galactoside ABC-type transport system permease subunit
MQLENRIQTAIKGPFIVTIGMAVIAAGLGYVFCVDEEGERADLRPFSRSLAPFWQVLVGIIKTIQIMW